MEGWEGKKGDGKKGVVPLVVDVCVKNENIVVCLCL